MAVLSYVVTMLIVNHDYAICWYLKEYIFMYMFINKPRRIQELKDEIIRHINGIEYGPLDKDVPSKT